MADVLDEIEKALEAATGAGRWWSETRTDGRPADWAALGDLANEFEMPLTEDDAHLIAHAPEWLRSCVSLIRKLRDDNDRMDNNEQFFEAKERQLNEWIEHTEQALESAESTVQKLREFPEALVALEDGPGMGSPWVRHEITLQRIINRARAVLSDLPGGE